MTALLLFYIHITGPKCKDLTQIYIFVIHLILFENNLKKFILSIGNSNI